MDPVLFAFGAARIVVWVAIAVVGYRQRRMLPLAFGSLAALTSVVFAIGNAHGQIPGILTDVSTFVALPIATLIFAGVLVTRPAVPARDGWHL